MPRIGPTELIIILVIVLIIFGVGRLPQVGGAIGKSLRAFRKGVDGKDEEEGEDKIEGKATAKPKRGDVDEEDA